MIVKLYLNEKESALIRWALHVLQLRLLDKPAAVVKTVGKKVHSKWTKAEFLRRTKKLERLVRHRERIAGGAITGRFQ